MANTRILHALKLILRFEQTKDKKQAISSKVTSFNFSGDLEIVFLKYFEFNYG